MHKTKTKTKKHTNNGNVKITGYFPDNLIIIVNNDPGLKKGTLTKKNSDKENL